jgi:hypothetical protein
MPARPVRRRRRLCWSCAANIVAVGACADVAAAGAMLGCYRAACAAGIGALLLTAGTLRHHRP